MVNAAQQGLYADLASVIGRRLSDASIMGNLQSH